MVEAAHEIPPIPTHQEVTRDVLGRFQDLGARYWGWVTVLSFLFVLGILGFVIRLTSGFDDRSIWGYHVATMSFIVTTFLAMPIISAAGWGGLRRRRYTPRRNGRVGTRSETHLGGRRARALGRGAAARALAVGAARVARL